MSAEHSGKDVSTQRNRDKISCNWKALVKVSAA